MSILKIYLDFIYKEHHRKMVWSLIVVAWDRCNIIMPAHKVLCKGYLSAERVLPSDFINPPAGPPKII